MTPQYDVVVAGGGLAGCAAAIMLAREGYSVALREKSRLPHHKLCGEFLSVEASALFDKLGVLGAVIEAGAKTIDRVTMTTPRGAVFRVALPGKGLGLSRYTLDPIMMQAARDAGADCRESSSITAIDGGFERGFVVSSGDELLRARIVLAAYGKRSGIDSLLGRKFLTQPSGYVAFKQHFIGDIADTIEMHSFPGGYCGLSPVENGRVNACFIADSSLVRHFGSGWREIATGTMANNPRLAARLSSMQTLPESLRVVANPSLAPKPKFEGDICMIGDAAGMIAPLCGDGMSMALRSAEIASPLAAAWLDGKISGDGYRTSYTAQWNREFAQRIAIGRVAHRAAMHPGTADLAVQLCATIPAVGQWLIGATRG